MRGRTQIFKSLLGIFRWLWATATLLCSTVKLLLLLLLSVLNGALTEARVRAGCALRTLWSRWQGIHAVGGLLTVPVARWGPRGYITAETLFGFLRPSCLRRPSLWSHTLLAVVLLLLAVRRRRRRLLLLLMQLLNVRLQRGRPGRKILCRVPHSRGGCCGLDV